MAFLCVTPARADPIGFDDLLSRPAPVATQRFAYGPAPSQFAELWLPKRQGPIPTVIMIHGGCWQASLPGVVLMAYIAEDLRQSGIAVWNIEYRRLGEAGGGDPGTFLDIAHGIDGLRSIAPEYKLDLSNLVAIGHSAGGHLALWAAARGKIPVSSKLYVADPLPIRTVVTLSGIDDLRAYRDTGPDACGGPATIDGLINAQGRAGTDPYADTSPAAMLPLKIRQLIVSGELDPIVPEQFAEDYVRQARAKGDPASWLEIGGAGHFEMIDPTSAAWAQIKPLLLAYLKKQ